MLRASGLSYAEVEKNGYQLPLIESRVFYKQPAVYDDLLEVQADLNELYSPKVHIQYIIRRKETNDIIAEGYTTHIFIKSETKKAVRPPQIYVNVLKPFFGK